MANGHGLTAKGAARRPGRRARLMVVALAAALIAIGGCSWLAYRFYHLDAASAQQGEARAEPLIAALERYRQDVGLYPARWVDLVPRYLDAIPRPAPRYEYDGVAGEAGSYVLWFLLRGTVYDYDMYASRDHRWYHFHEVVPWGDYLEEHDSLPVDCREMPLGGLADVWRDRRVGPVLGCVLAPAEAVSGTEAYLCCAHSIWLAERQTFVVIEDAGARWSFVADGSGLPAGTPPMAEPAPRDQPCFPATGRHGWLANSAGWKGKCGGNSKGPETVFKGSLQQFEHGWLLWNGNVCFVLYANGAWMMF